MRILLCLFNLLCAASWAAPPTPSQEVRISFDVYQPAGITRDYSKRDPVGFASVERIPHGDGTVHVEETISAVFMKTVRGNQFSFDVPITVNINRTAVEDAEGRMVRFKEIARVADSEITAEYDPSSKSIHVVTDHTLMPPIKTDHDVTPGMLAPTRQMYDLFFSRPNGKRKREYAYMFRGGAMMSKPTAVTTVAGGVPRFLKPKGFRGQTQQWTSTKESLLLGDGDKVYFDASGRLQRWTIRLFDLNSVEAFPSYVTAPEVANR